MMPLAEQTPEIRDQGPFPSASSDVASFALAPRSLGAGGSSPLDPRPLRVAVLTGGGDKPYALGMAAALTSEGISVDFIGSDDLSVPELLTNRRVNFLNLRGDQNPNATPTRKMARVCTYYWRLVCYSAKAKPKIFHILWNNKFQLFDCTLLMLYYKLLHKRIVFTAHNVNAGKRDSDDSWLNRLSLKVQYNLSDHILVHTEGMKREMISQFHIPESKVSVIPFGINNTVPNTDLSSGEAKRRLAVSSGDKTLLFFGNIAPYKGLEYLIAAFSVLLKKDRSYRLLIVGKPKGPKSYWDGIWRTIVNNGIGGRVIDKIEYVPDEATELYFKAADALVLPYARVFQSGVLFLGYNFGLPAIAADVASLKNEIIEGKTGLVFRAQDPSDLASKIDEYFNSELFSNLENTRFQIKQYANDRYSWSKVADITKTVYSNLLSSR
ncbi:MAG TPA: glycosyltransferase family 4 protein [Terriglobales bacterium]|nr:glycosyltransferase family 4 protein [Terriglobales bacterium]